MLMYMQLVADGQDISRFKGEHISAACAYIAHSIACHGSPERNVVAQIQYNTGKSSGSIRTSSATRREAAQSGGWMKEVGIRSAAAPLAQQMAVGETDATIEVQGNTQVGHDRQVARDEFAVSDQDVH